MEKLVSHLAWDWKAKIHLWAFLCVSKSTHPNILNWVSSVVAYNFFVLCAALFCRLLQAVTAFDWNWGEPTPNSTIFFCSFVSKRKKIPKIATDTKTKTKKKNWDILGTNTEKKYQNSLLVHAGVHVNKSEIWSIIKGNC